MARNRQAAVCKKMTRPPREFRCLSMKHIFQFISTLILPILLGVFTIVITFNQQKIAREQWLGDQHELRQQRQQELNIANAQRDEQRRDSLKRYEDELLLDYVKEIGELLRESNGSLMSTTTTRILGRVKTLNALRQLDGSRSKLIIQFLYEALQLTDRNGSIALDISKATLLDITGNALNTLDEIGTLSLRGATLENWRLNNSRLKKIDFSFAMLSNIDFSSVQRLYEVNFSSAELNNVDFSFTKHFDEIDLPSEEPQPVDSSLSFHRIYHADFSFTKILNVNFSSVQPLYSVNFSSARLIHVCFSSTHLQMVDFSSAQLNWTNFSAARLSRIHFSFGSSIENSDFTSTYLAGVFFPLVKFRNPDFSSAQLFTVDASDAEFEHAKFRRARLAYSKFPRAKFFDGDFSYARLDIFLLESLDAASHFHKLLQQTSMMR